MKCKNAIQIWNNKDIPAKIIDIIPANNWIVVDTLGKLYQLNSDYKQEIEPIFTTNSGKINDLAIGVLDCAVIVGQDGYVRLLDYVNNCQFYDRQFPKEATCVDWVPYTFTKLHSGRVVITGFSNGIVRWLLLNQDGFFLLKALKVHKQGIQQLKCSPAGDVVCILSDEGDIFFIEQNPKDLQKFNPFCFYETELKINDFAWDKHGEKIIIGAEDGFIYQLEMPKVENCDTSETYKQEFQPSKWKMKMMEFQKPKTEEMDIEFLLKRNKNEDKKDQEWETDSIMNVQYLNNQIIATVKGNYLGYLYFIDINKERPTKAIQISKQETSNLNFSLNQEILIISYIDGKYQLYPTKDFEKFTEVRTHDKDYGKVRKTVINHNNNAVISVADDGSMYSYKFDFDCFMHYNQDSQTIFPDFSSPITSNSFTDQVNIIEEESDIINDNIYSIQQAKILEEEDFRKKEAEKRKQKVLQIIQTLQDKYNECKNLNNKIEDIARLSEKEMTVDPQYEEMLKQRVLEDLEETRLQLKYDAEKFALLTQKLKSKMKDELVTDRFGVTTVEQPFKTVYTFKIKNLSEYVQEQLKQVYRSIEFNIEQQQKENNEQPKIMLNDSNKLTTTKQEDKKDNETNLDNFVAPEGLTGAKLEKAKHKWEEARIRRQLEELELQKPQKQSMDPDHQKEIANAYNNFGDFKLKSDPNYIVPENFQIKDYKKRQLIFMMEEYIYNTKLGFNNYIISLRQRKKEIIEKSKKYNERIHEINNKLGIKETLFTPNLNDAIENPELDFEISEAQVDEFEKTQEKEAQKKKSSMGMGGDEKKENPTVIIQETQVKKKESIVGAMKKRNVKIQNTPLEDEMQKINDMILLSEKKEKLCELQDDIQQLDKEIIREMGNKNILESQFTTAQMKLTTYYQELLILQNMKQNDDELTEALKKIENDRNELDLQSQKITEDLQNLNEKDQNNEKELNEQMKIFKAQVHPDDEIKREKIHQYFLKKKKKIDQKHLKLSKNDNNDEEIDEDEIDDDEDDDDDMFDDDDDEKPDISQIDGDPKIKEVIDKIVQTELDQEKVRKEKMDLERTKNQLHNKGQAVLMSLQKAENELRAYQRKKLQRVNQLNISHILYIEQIQNGILEMKNEEVIFKLPQTLDNSILFTKGDYFSLGKRILQLESEQKEIKVTKSRLEKKKKHLEKKKIELDKEADDLNKKLNEKHQLKFGDFIDLKILDALEPTKDVIEMKEKFKREEITAIKNVEKAKFNLLEKKKALVKEKKKNTEIIEKITELGSQKMKLDQKLDSTNQQLLKEENEEKKYKNDLKREKENLNDLVKFLTKEIDDLKTEIGLFKRKGGHIYTMVTNNKKG